MITYKVKEEVYHGCGEAVARLQDGIVNDLEYLEANRSNKEAVTKLAARHPGAKLVMGMASGTEFIFNLKKTSKLQKKMAK